MAGVDFPLGPIIDGKFIPKNPLEMTAAGESNQVATMVGCLSEEGNTMFLMDAYQGATERSTWNKTVFDGTIGMTSGTMDELILDTISLFFTSPEEVSTIELGVIIIVHLKFSFNIVLLYL